MSNETPLGNQTEPYEPERIDPALWKNYTDDTYHFNISYPPHYAIKYLSKAELAQLSPLPLAAIYFLDQRNNLAEIAPPAFSICIYENKERQSIEGWLTRVGLLNRKAGWLTEPYQGKSVVGVKVFSPNLMAPGWFVYVADDIYIFRLTPLGTEAEQMLDTFELVP
jgi:hypothetical protein